MSAHCDGDIDQRHMRRALQLAGRGEGAVEPNPMVGCVIARGDEVLGEGWHARFGEEHAEVMALRTVDPTDLRDATMYVTLEPCTHQGKTPPCVDAILRTDLTRIVVAMVDPFQHVSGRGIARLREAGRTVELGVLHDEARFLAAPYCRFIEQGRPWVIAKWAMTLDGRIATHRGESHWISGEESRRVVHQIRGRMDGILVGRGTVQQDDPRLTPRPPGLRRPCRIVADSRATLALDSQLVRSIAEAPVLVVASELASTDAMSRLRDHGCDVFVCPGANPVERLQQLFAELGRRQMTNILVEGGGHLIGTLFDAKLVDELQLFISPRVMGGAGALSPVLGTGAATICELQSLQRMAITRTGDDIHIQGRLMSSP